MIIADNCYPLTFFFFLQSEILSVHMGLWSCVHEDLEHQQHPWRWTFHCICEMCRSSVHFLHPAVAVSHLGFCFCRVMVEMIQMTFKAEDNQMQLCLCVIGNLSSWCLGEELQTQVLDGEWPFLFLWYPDLTQEDFLNDSTTMGNPDGQVGVPQQPSSGIILDRVGSWPSLALLTLKTVLQLYYDHLSFQEL